jgi:hypothetical protein
MAICLLLSPRWRSCLKSTTSPSGGGRALSVENVPVNDLSPSFKSGSNDDSLSLSLDTRCMVRVSGHEIWAILESKQMSLPCSLGCRRKLEERFPRRPRVIWNLELRRSGQSTCSSDIFYFIVDALIGDCSLSSYKLDWLKPRNNTSNRSRAAAFSQRDDMRGCVVPLDCLQRFHLGVSPYIRMSAPLNLASSAQVS